MGRPDLRFHDLRHTGFTWSASLGATTAELMHPGGHDSPVAALCYKHATQDRDAVLANALGSLASGEIRQLRTPGGQRAASSTTKTIADLVTLTPFREPRF